MKNLSNKGQRNLKTIPFKGMPISKRRKKVKPKVKKPNSKPFPLWLVVLGGMLIILAITTIPNLVSIPCSGNGRDAPPTIDAEYCLYTTITGQPIRVVSPKGTQYSIFADDTGVRYDEIGTSFSFHLDTNGVLLTYYRGITDPIVTLPILEENVHIKDVGGIMIDDLYFQFFNDDWLLRFNEDYSITTENSVTEPSVGAST